MGDIRTATAQRHAQFQSGLERRRARRFAQMGMLVGIDVTRISVHQSSESANLVRYLSAHGGRFVERHYTVDRRPVLVFIDPFSEVQVQSHAKVKTSFSERGCLESSRPAYHQACAGHDTLIMGMDHAKVYPRAVAEIIRIHN